MRQPLAEILFDDEDKEVAEALRDSVVAPARGSPRAQHKASLKRTEEGIPVHSFNDLLKNLSTIAINQMRVVSDKANDLGMGAEFKVVTTPTPFQHRIYKLLDVPLTL